MNFDDLKGLTLTSVTTTEFDVHFSTTCGRSFRLLHHQDCCESVYVESIVGDLSDLIGTPLLLAEEVTSDRPYTPGSIEHVTAKITGTTFDNANDSNTWTFYKLATIKGYVDIRFHGTSNGYYSESVNFEEIT